LKALLWFYYYYDFYFLPMVHLQLFLVFFGRVYDVAVARKLHDFALKVVDNAHSHTQAVLVHKAL